MLILSDFLGYVMIYSRTRFDRCTTFVYILIPCPISLSPLPTMESIMEDVLPRVVPHPTQVVHQFVDPVNKGKSSKQYLG